MIHVLQLSIRAAEACLRIALRLHVNDRGKGSGRVRPDFPLHTTTLDVMPCLQIDRQRHEGAKTGMPHDVLDSTSSVGPGLGSLRSRRAADVQMNLQPTHASAGNERAGGG